jgi:hypothetical protein
LNVSVDFLDHRAFGMNQPMAAGSDLGEPNIRHAGTSLGTFGNWPGWWTSNLKEFSHEEVDSAARDRCRRTVCFRRECRAAFERDLRDAG